MKEEYFQKLIVIGFSNIIFTVASLSYVLLSKIICNYEFYKDEYYDSDYVYIMHSVVFFLYTILNLIFVSLVVIELVKLRKILCEFNQIIVNPIALKLYTSTAIQNVSVLDSSTIKKDNNLDNL